MIELINLSKSFDTIDGEVHALKNINLRIEDGDVYGIIGMSGAGKSTLVNLVCRFFEPTEGRVLIDGRDVRERSQGWLHANNVVCG